MVSEHEINLSKERSNLTGDFLERIRKVARRRIIYAEHALDEMNMEKEIISKE
jgi:hypothetical protein